MTLVDSNLHLGDYKNASDYFWLRGKGIRMIINAAEEVPNYFPDRFIYINLRMKDDPDKPVNLELFESVYKIIEHERSVNRPILVHCRAGVNRSAIMILYYLMRKYGADYNDVFDVLSRLRPIINPHPIYVQYALYAKKRYHP